MFQIGGATQKFMSNSKQLNALNMLDQSVIYLYNSYREQGYSSEQAKEKVAHALESTYRKYVDKEIIRPNKSHTLFNINIKEIIDDILKDISDLSISIPLKTNLKQRLERLKTLF